MARRDEFVAQLRRIDPAKLVFLDESGSHISMTRDHGWAPVGQRLVQRVPRNRGTVLTMIGAITLAGVEALMTNVGGTSAKVFRSFVDGHLVPVLREGDVVVMDNLGAHHATGVREAIEAAGASVLYMPPYSPDLNPIELCWSKLKLALKGIGARTVDKLRRAISTARRAITAEDALGWFSHCGIQHQVNC